MILSSIRLCDCVCAGSCVGRCGEVFTRGRQCTCDFSCLQHHECCQDFEATCTTAQSCQGRCGEPFRRGQLCECDPQCTRHNTCCHDYQLHCGKDQHFPLTISGGLQPVSIPSSRSGSPVSPTPLSALPSYSALSQGGRAPVSPSGPGAVGGEVNGHPMQSPGGAPQRSSIQGELFWSVDPVSRSVGQPQRITDTLGVSSPIDAVFTRCSCSRNTYIIKGDQYWSLDENMAVEPGFPRPLTSEFPGLTGPIRAALAVPATKTRPETVYFFKNGEEDRRRSPPQQILIGNINIRVSLNGFPTPVSSALSMPSPDSSNRFYHYIFSGPLYFRVQIVGDLPALAKPDPSSALAPLPIFSPAAMPTNSANMATQNPNPTYPVNSITVWLRCP
uniref:Proteoglycan 4a n=1 Tax=Lates calcarifer TaxID=8187 RepID=A0A4W6E5U6_LATCA